MTIIIFGLRNGKILTEKIEETCPNCETKNSLAAIVSQEYFQLFYIPFFPLEKIGFIHCTNCKTEVSHQRLTPHYKNLYLQAHAKAKTPFWAFIGPLLGVLILISVIIVTRFNSEYDADFIRSPQKRDLYQVKTDDDQYTLYFVKAVSADSVFILKNQKQTKIKEDAAYLTREKYDEKVYSISKTDLKKMFATGIIYNVERYW